MKKFFLCSFLIFASAFAFADKNRFYEDGRLIDNMYVDATSGLRVRDKPDLSGNKIAVLPHSVIVKLVAVGKTENIDDKDDPWIEVMLPSYMWKEKGVPEYGWIYGGYLVNKQPVTYIPTLKGKALEEFLCKPYEWISGGITSLRFEKNGTFHYGVDCTSISLHGTFKVDGSTVVLNHDSGKIEYLEISKMTRSYFDISNTDFINSGKYSASYYLSLDRDFSKIDTEGFHFLESYEFVSSNLYMTYHDDNFLQSIISRGFHCEHKEYYFYDTFMAKYRSYWDPIMKEHQKKADKM